jgi:hypothetical protein
VPGQKSIYVRAEDDDLWQWAQAYARAHRMPVSALIMLALERLREDENPGE